jgi:VanZ like protein
VLALVFFTLAVSTEIYDLTSPAFLAWHVALRKAYSVAAFSILAFFARGALREQGSTRPALATIVTLTLFSTLIEVAQFAGGVREGLAWNALDVACGTAGGIIGAVAYRVVRGKAKR